MITRSASVRRTGWSGPHSRRLPTTQAFRSLGVDRSAAPINNHAVIVTREFDRDLLVPDVVAHALRIPFERIAEAAASRLNMRDEGAFF